MAMVGKGRTTAAAAMLRGAGAMALAGVLAASAATAAETETKAQGEAASQSLVARGAVEYRENCAVCHGWQGRGDGLLEPVLAIKPADLTGLSRAAEGRFPFERLYRIIDGRADVRGHGSGSMPVWGRAFRREADADARRTVLHPDPELVVAGRIFSLLRYLESIQE